MISKPVRTVNVSYNLDHHDSAKEAEAVEEGACPRNCWESLMAAVEEGAAKGLASWVVLVEESLAETREIDLVTPIPGVLGVEVGRGDADLVKH